MRDGAEGPGDVVLTAPLGGEERGTMTEINAATSAASAG